MYMYIYIYIYIFVNTQIPPLHNFFWPNSRKKWHTSAIPVAVLLPYFRMENLFWAFLYMYMKPFHVSLSFVLPSVMSYIRKLSVLSCLWFDDLKTRAASRDYGQEFSVYHCGRTSGFLRKLLLQEVSKFGSIYVETRASGTFLVPRQLMVTNW